MISLYEFVARGKQPAGYAEVQWSRDPILGSDVIHYRARCKHCKFVGFITDDESWAHRESQAHNRAEHPIPDDEPIENWPEPEEH